MTSIWQKIEAWYAENGASHLLNPGASEADITATEKRLNVNFPPELRESLRRHNGSTEDGWVAGELLSLEGIEREHALWTELLNDGAFDINASINAGNEEVQSGWWHPAWIPLDADGGGNGCFVDTAPGPAGTVGQVRYMDHEVGPESEAQSLTDYLKEVLEELDSGEYHYYKNEESGFEGICDQETVDDFERDGLGEVM